MKFLLIITVLFFMPTYADIRTLYNSLKPDSLSQNLAFYELFPNTDEGKCALKRAQALYPNLNVNLSLDPIIALVNKQPGDSLETLSEQALEQIEALANHLPNRRLAGRSATSEAEVIAMCEDQIDITRAVFLTQLGEREILKIRTYEALIDLMALQIIVRFPLNASPIQKIRTINEFVFCELGFRFPPHSEYPQDIDLYTFLPSVLDSRHGVCLGVSLLYLGLAQRLDLPLEMITPPGHIYVRYRDHNQVINIETTARGIHVDSEEYLGINTRSLQQRNLKEVIGLVHFNQAAAYLRHKKYDMALQCYKKAQPYLPKDPFLQELTGYMYILLGNESEARPLLEGIKGVIPSHAISKESLAEDFLNGYVDIKGVDVYFKEVDESRESINEKRIALEDILRQWPLFRAGYASLASTWLQLHRYGEALEILEKYHALDPNDPTAEYYLSALYTERFDYNKAWKHLKEAEKLVKARDHYPKVLKDLRRELQSISPE